MKKEKNDSFQEDQNSHSQFQGPLSSLIILEVSTFIVNNQVLKLLTAKLQSIKLEVWTVHRRTEWYGREKAKGSNKEKKGQPGRVPP